MIMRQDVVMHKGRSFVVVLWTLTARSWVGIEPSEELLGVQRCHVGDDSVVLVRGNSVFLGVLVSSLGDTPVLL